MWYVVFHFFRLLVQSGDWTCKCKDLFRVLENFQPAPSLSHSLRAKYWLKTGNYSNSGFRFKQWHVVVRFLIGASVSKLRCKIFKYCFKTTDSIKRGGVHVAAARKRSHQWCLTLTLNNTETIERMTCHCFLRPIGTDLTSSSYTTDQKLGSYLLYVQGLPLITELRNRFRISRLRQTVIVKFKKTIFQIRKRPIKLCKIILMDQMDLKLLTFLVIMNCKWQKTTDVSS